MSSENVIMINEIMEIVKKHNKKALVVYELAKYGLSTIRLKCYVDEKEIKNQNMPLEYLEHADAFKEIKEHISKENQIYIII